MKKISTYTLIILTGLFASTILLSQADVRTSPSSRQASPLRRASMAPATKNPQTPNLKSKKTPAKKTAHEQRWTLNQKDSDLRSFITQIASITGKTFIVDPKVDGRNVTVISSQSLTRDQVYDIFLSVLDTNGFAAIPQGNQVRITLSSNAKALSNKLLQGESQGTDYIKTEVIALTHISAIEVIPALRPLIAQDGQIAPIPSSNSVLINDHISNLKRIRRLIKRMDLADANGFEVIQLKHAWAGDLAKVIQKTLQSKAPQMVDSTQIIADEGSNRLIVFGTTGRRQQIRALARDLDIPIKRTSATMVINLRYADAKKLAEILQKVTKNLIQQDATYGQQRSPLRGSVVVEADESQNALVIIADPDTQQQLLRLIRKLDVRREQLLLETAIVEFSGNADQALGVQWGLSGLSTNQKTESTDTGGTFTNTTLGKIVGFSPASIPLGTVALRNNTFGALVSAIAGKSNSDLLSTPSLLTLDNQKSKIFVGEERSFETGSYSGSGSGSGSTGSSFSSPFNTFDRKQVGLTLEVTPHINDNGSIRLEINQKVQNVAPSDNQTQVPGQEVVNDRELKTNVLIDDKQTIVLGGLLSDQTIWVNNKVPLLGDIPLFGELFHYRSHQRVKRNLMVFIRPTILTKRFDADGLTYDKYSQLLFLGNVKNRSQHAYTNRHIPNSPKNLFGEHAMDPSAVDMRSQTASTKTSKTQAPHKSPK